MKEGNFLRAAFIAQRIFGRMVTSLGDYQKAESLCLRLRSALNFERLPKTGTPEKVGPSFRRKFLLAKHKQSVSSCPKSALNQRFCHVVLLFPQPFVTLTLNPSENQHLCFTSEFLCSGFTLEQLHMINIGTQEGMKSWLYFSNGGQRALCLKNALI